MTQSLLTPIKMTFSCQSAHMHKGEEGELITSVR